MNQFGQAWYWQVWVPSNIYSSSLCIMINFIQHTIHKKKQTVLNRRLNIRPLCFCKWDMGVQIIHNKSTSWGDIDDEKTSICITLSKISKRIEKKTQRRLCRRRHSVICSSSWSVDNLQWHTSCNGGNRIADLELLIIWYRSITYRNIMPNRKGRYSITWTI